ncbi:hypothetical protein WN51_00520 [Melipona quadrifasciata]|uniref:Centromere protein K n=1 Tax=Melipona quadrifasciata TaxID=166423 RepID=A0A0M8ZZZ6_9HYME|nr:hypothetical protein WN51_00520 [Melipona quadrifasciata]
MEYTLQDAFETLKESQVERQKEIEDLTNVIPNNFRQVALQKTCNSEDVKNKQHKLCKSLLNQVLLEEPKDYPVPETSDLHAEVLAELEKEVQNARQLFERMKTQLSDIKNDISYLENKKLGLDKMKEAYLGAQQLTANTTYNMEYATAKRIFRSVKEDLHAVVEGLFPKNDNFRNFLADLISSYSKGGNDLYVNVTPEILHFVNFLIEADIAVYHRNDKTKVRLMNML